MNRVSRIANGTMLSLIALTAITTIPAHADGWPWSHGGRSHNSRSEDANRQDSKNNWRNLALGSGAAAVAGLLTHNKTLTIIGTAGAAYSASRYEKDRKNQSEDSGWGSDRRRYHRDENRGDNRNYDDNRTYDYQPQYDYRDGNYDRRTTGDGCEQR